MIKYMSIWFKISLLLVLGLIYCYLILFTNYAPDVYVFVQYAYKDSLLRNITLNSFIDNNFIFDFFIVIGDFLEISDPTDWLIFITFVSVVLFIAKYAILLFSGRWLAVVIVYFASFYVDLNQLRFNMAGLFLVLFILLGKSKFRLIAVFFSFSSHIVPASLYLLAWLRRRFVRVILFVIPGIIFMLAFGFFKMASESRIADYFAYTPTVYPKILFVFFPTVFYLYKFKTNLIAMDKIHAYAVTCVFIGISFFFVNFELSARFFEIAFIVVAVLNVYHRRSLAFDLFLLVLSISIVTSRSLSGISTASDFIDGYKLQPF
jgi:hypothetical protein